MRRVAVPVMALAGILMVAGCGSKDKTGEPSGQAKNEAELQQEAAKLDRPRPGQYRQTIEITDMDMPGMPPSAVEHLKQTLTQAKEQTICLTKEDTEKGFREMFRDVDRTRECTYSRFDVSGSRLDAVMDCRSSNGNVTHMTMAGKVSAEGSDVTMEMKTSGGDAQAGPMSAMNMTMHLTTTRIGDCAS